MPRHSVMLGIFHWGVDFESVGRGNDSGLKQHESPEICKVLFGLEHQALLAGCKMFRVKALDVIDEVPSEENSGGNA